MPASFADVCRLVKADMSCLVLSSGASDSGSSTETASRKACGRDLTWSGTLTTSLNVSRSLSFIAEPSKSFSTCLKILLGERAWISSAGCGLGLSVFLAPSVRKGRQALSADRSKTFLTMFTRRLSCLTAFGVLFSSTVGVDALIAPRIWFFIGRLAPVFTAPTYTCPRRVIDSGWKGTFSRSSAVGVVNCQSTSLTPEPLMLSSR